jgi:hypothetical protein
MLNKIRPKPWDWPGPDRPASCRPQRRPGPSISVPTWALCYPKQCQSSELDLRFSASIARTVAPFHFISHRLCSLERERERKRERENAGGHKGVAEGWVVAVALPTRLLADVRRSPEGERTAVEPSHGGALWWRPEPIRRRPNKWRRTRGGTGPFPEHVIFDDGRSGRGGEVGPSYR